YRFKIINHQYNESYIPAEIVKEDYNSSAHSYEDIMVNNFKYEAPDILAKSIATYINKEDSYKALDIGCGTGLAGYSLAQEVSLKSLIGIDISTKMLELTKTLEKDGNNIYTELKEMDFHDLELLKDKYGIILACLSLGYVNDFSNFYKKLDKLVKNGVIFGIVVLKSNAGDIEFNYDQACFAYSAKFLKEISQKFNWDILEEKEIVLFCNNTKGLMFILTKK
ncbi:MAG: methyltransferase domain-containing protein, partial [Pseudomonadota bacterium]